ncbi:MAG: substrate-binding periplasmic protein [Oleiphilus sp.]
MKNKVIALWFFLLVLTASPLQAQTTHQEVLTIHSDSWMPFNGDPKAKNRGYIIDLVSEIFEAEEIQIEYTITPWARSLILCEEGKINAVVGAADVDVPGFVLPEEALDFTYEAFFKHKDNPWFYDGDINSLESEKLGYVIDYATRDDLLAYFDKHQKSDKVQLIGGNTPLQQNITKLIHGRISVLLENSNVVRYQLKKMNVSQDIVFAGNLYEDAFKMYIAFSPKHPRSKAYADIFDKGFRRLKASGRVNEIRQKYGMSLLD